MEIRFWYLLLKEVLLEVRNNVCVGGPPVYIKGSKGCLTLLLYLGHTAAKILTLEDVSKLILHSVEK